MRITTCIIALVLSTSAVAELGADDALGAFVSGVRAFDNGHFERAAELFEAVLVVQSDCARCAHMLGKSYGRLTEKAGWTAAIGLAKKTRLALEQAVTLAPNDPDAIKDLIKYYRRAPGFLGGSDEKAEALELHLRQVETKHTS